MSAVCLRWLLNYSARAIPSASLVHWSPISRLTASKDKPGAFPLAFCRSAFCTATEDTKPTPEPKKKKSKPSDASISNVGRRIRHSHIQVVGENGEDLGTMESSAVVRLMDEQGLKLVRENQNPPLYRLISGKQMQEERLKLHKSQKERPAPVQVKELSFSSATGTQDILFKLKHVESWLKKKYHVKITVQARGGFTVNLVTTLESFLEKIETAHEFVSTPKAIREGRAAVCVLRPLSAKNLAEKLKKTTAVNSKSASTEDTSETPVLP